VLYVPDGTRTAMTVIDNVAPRFWTFGMTMSLFGPGAIENQS
jgi:hypothetical protein